MGERKLLLGVSMAVIGASILSVGYLAAMGMLTKLDGISLAFMALLIAAVFAVASMPEVLSMYPLPPAVDTSVVEDHHAPTVPFFMKVWGILLFFTAIEVAMAYMQPKLQLSVTVMLTVLMLLSIFKAGLIVAYFMHLRFERMSLVLTLIPSVVLCICLLNIFFPESIRMHDLGTERHMLELKPPVPEAGEAH